MPPAVRQQFGDYLLLRLLGEGGMGSVFLARHTSTGQEVAIKIMAPHLTQNPKVVKRFESEARAVMRINHPNVISIFDYGRADDGTLFHIMEVLDGVDLAAVMERRRFTPVEVLPFVTQICGALQAAHDRSVVHRDLKPENIFVLNGRPLTIKVLDFGIAKLLDPDEFLNLTATGVAIGTPMFIAPEQAMGDKHNISPQTDIYSLGVVLYAMLCGAPPFQSEGIGSLLVMHINEPPPPLLGRAPHLPEAVAGLVHRCLEKDPARRPRSAAAVARDFEQALGAAPSVEAPLGFQPRSTVPDAADPNEDGRATVVDPRYQGDLHSGPTYVDPSRPAHLTPATDPPPGAEVAAVTFRDAVSPAVLLGQPRPERRGFSAAHLIALGGAVVGLALIVALVVVAIRLMGG